jgi:hypothetical protein
MEGQPDRCRAVTGSTQSTSSGVSRRQAAPSRLIQVTFEVLPAEGLSMASRDLGAAGGRRVTCGGFGTDVVVALKWLPGGEPSAG